MIAAPIPDNEFVRLQALRSLKILNTQQDPRFDAIAQFAAYLLGAPISTISFVNANCAWFKSAYGLDIKEVPRKTSICAHIISENNSRNPLRRIYEISDLSKDERFHDNPLVSNGFKLRSYISYVLQSESGMNIGTLCVFDTVPRNFSEGKKGVLILLGTMVENLLNGRHHLQGIKNKI
jgi:GAF domain-containing protein